MLAKIQSSRSCIMVLGVICRERNDGLYSALAYLLFKLFEECLLSLGTSIFMSAAVFFAVKLQGNWLLFWFAFYLTTCTGIGKAPRSCPSLHG